MGKKKYTSSDVTPEAKKPKPKSEDLDSATNLKKRKSIDSSNIMHFVEPKKKKKKSESEISSVTAENNDSVLIESASEKKLRFNIDGEIVESKKETDNKGSNSATKKKIRKPRWSEEKKVEEKERKASEPPKEEEEYKPKTKKKKKSKKKIALNQEGTSALAISAIQYLQTWQYDRSSWKFSKIKQTWLLKNIFDLSKVPSSVFPVLVEYITGSKGGSRLRTYEAASKVIQKLEENVVVEETTEEDEIAKCLTEDSEEDKEEIHQRARSIMQALSDCT